MLQLKFKVTDREYFLSKTSVRFLREDFKDFKLTETCESCCTLLDGSSLDRLSVWVGLACVRVRVSSHQKNVFLRSEIGKPFLDQGYVLEILGELFITSKLGLFRVLSDTLGHSAPFLPTLTGTKLYCSLSGQTISFCEY